MNVPCFAADLIGPMARQSLSQHSSGTVLAGSSRAIYLCGAGGELLWLAPGDVPMHRRGIRVPARLPRPKAGSAYRVTDATLLLGSALSIELSRAAVWKAQGFSGASRPLEERLRGAGACLSSLLPDLPPPTGFGAYLVALSEYAAGNPFPGRTPKRDLVGARAYPAVRGIARACREHDLGSLLRHAERLVGLGEGLTPSGDDYIGGVLFGLAMLQEAGARLPWYSMRGVASFAETAATRTNRISAALLADHAAGHASEVLHRFVLALLVNEAPEAARREAMDLIRIGHSTGWDLLTGVWTSMMLAPSGAPPALPQACTPALAATT